MFYRIAISLCVSVIVLTATSCGKPDYDGTAAKIKSHRTLDSDDYDVMIDYMTDVTDAMIPKLKEAKTIEDIQNIDTDITSRYRYTDLFNTALLHDYNKLSDGQKESIEKNRQKASQAFSDQ